MATGANTANANAETDAWFVGYAPVGAPQSGETHMRMTTRNGWTSLSVKVDGAVEFTDDDRDVLAAALEQCAHRAVEQRDALPVA